MARATLSPECRLVFLSANPVVNDAAIAEAVRGPVEWNRAVWIAEKEHAAAGLWRALERSARDIVPPNVADHLRKNAMVSDFKMLHLETRLQQTLAALKKRGVQGMLLKGAALGSSIYPSFVERPMADVDLLVRTSDVAEARLAILETGWGEHQIAALNELLADHHHLVPFFDKGSTGLRLELHTSVMPTRHPFRIDENEIWRRAVPTRDAFSNVLAPHPMHLLYHACLHFSWSHTMQFGAWRTFRDINELARTGRVDWNEFVQFAAASRAATACYWALRLARLLSNAELPAFAMQRLQSPGGEFVRRAVDRHFLSYIAPGEGPTSPSVRLEKLMWRAAIRPRWSGHTGQHGQPVEEQSWEMVLHGAKPDKPSSRIVRHMKHASEWWNYLTQTFGA